MYWRIELYKGDTCYQFERIYQVDEYMAALDLLKALKTLGLIDNFLIRKGGKQWL